MKLKDYLAANGIRQSWFAEQVGVDRHVLCRWVNSQIIPKKPAQKLIQILTKDNVKPEDWKYEPNSST